MTDNLAMMAAEDIEEMVAELCKPWTEFYGHTEEIAAIISKHFPAPPADALADLRTIQQAVGEFAHAYHAGPEWFTKGESGLRMQVKMWLDKAGKALPQLEATIRTHSLTDEERKTVEEIAYYQDPGHSGLTPHEEKLLAIIERLSPSRAA